MLTSLCKLTASSSRPVWPSTDTSMFVMRATPNAAALAAVETSLASLGVEALPDARTAANVDEDDDLDFVKGLFRKTIINNDEYQNTIIKQAKNWEEDRIAMMDFLLMKMAICELEEFPTVPIKVTLNEYIELSKNYSTPKSKLFINGILDKLIPQLKAEGKINKSGRGLKE